LTFERADWVTVPTNCIPATHRVLFLGHAKMGSYFDDQWTDSSVASHC
jgi:hypothetical protein